MCLPATLAMLRSLRSAEASRPRPGRRLTVVADRFPAPAKIKPLRVSHIVDLTHPLTPDFPSWPGYPSLEIRNTHRFVNDGFFANAWHIHEHSGTHVDAPLHFSEGGWSAAEIPPEALVVPAVVIDVRRRARRDPDTQVRPEDIKAWEKTYGRIPRDAAVLMWSGWEDRVDDQSAYRNADNRGIMHFPGFSRVAAEFLVKERGIGGIGVDTLSLDHGPSTDFGTHFAVLPANRWGIENLANLGHLPPRGATLFVGVPKVPGASGGHARILAAW